MSEQDIAALLALVAELTERVAELESQVEELTGDKARERRRYNLTRRCVG